MVQFPRVHASSGALEADLVVFESVLQDRLVYCSCLSSLSWPWLFSGGGLVAALSFLNEAHDEGDFR